MNVDRSRDPGVAGVVAVGDASCHTDPGFAYGLSFALARAQLLAQAAAEAPDGDATVERYRQRAGPEGRERHALVCATDAAPSLRWSGESLEVGRRDSCYPLFAFAGAPPPRRTTTQACAARSVAYGLLDRTAAFDNDADLHERIETILAGAR